MYLPLVKRKYWLVSSSCATPQQSFGIISGTVLKQRWIRSSSLCKFETHHMVPNLASTISAHSKTAWKVYKTILVRKFKNIKYFSNLHWTQCLKKRKCCSSGSWENKILWKNHFYVWVLHLTVFNQCGWKL